MMADLKDLMFAFEADMQENEDIAPCIKVAQSEYAQIIYGMGMASLPDISVHLEQTAPECRFNLHVYWVILLQFIAERVDPRRKPSSRAYHHWLMWAKEKAKEYKENQLESLSTYQLLKLFEQNAMAQGNYLKDITYALSDDTRNNLNGRSDRLPEILEYFQNSEKASTYEAWKLLFWLIGYSRQNVFSNPPGNSADLKEWVRWAKNEVIAIDETKSLIQVFEKTLQYAELEEIPSLFVNDSGLPFVEILELGIPGMQVIYTHLTQNPSNHEKIQIGWIILLSLFAARLATTTVPKEPSYTKWYNWLKNKVLEDG